MHARTGPARTALLEGLAARWRGRFLDPAWSLDVGWAPEGPPDPPDAGSAYVIWDLWYARIEAHPLLPDELLERVVVHELAEVELYEVGRQAELLIAQLDGPAADLAREAHRSARHRAVEGRVARLLPGARTLPVWQDGRFVAGGGTPGGHP